MPYWRPPPAGSRAARWTWPSYKGGIAGFGEAPVHGGRRSVAFSVLERLPVDGDCRRTSRRRCGRQTFLDQRGGGHHLERRSGRELPFQGLVELGASGTLTAARTWPVAPTATMAAFATPRPGPTRQPPGPPDRCSSARGPGLWSEGGHRGAGLPSTSTMVWRRGHPPVATGRRPPDRFGRPCWPSRRRTQPVQLLGGDRPHGTDQVRRQSWRDASGRGVLKDTAGNLVQGTVSRPAAGSGPWSW